MRLRLRLTLILLTVNTLVLGSLALWVRGDQAQQELRERERQGRYANLVADRLPPVFQSGEARALREILSWDGWADFEEALLIDNRVLDLDGLQIPVGAFLNPKGSRHRTPAFPLEEITRAMTEASRNLTPVAVAGGLAIPLVVQEPFSTRPSEIWGGAYLRLASQPLLIPLSTIVLLAAVASTLLASALVYFFLGRTVIRPVERLAGAAHEFGEGGVPALPGSGQSAEIDELVDSFAQMMRRIRGFQDELETEVDRATQAAADAERRASRQDRLAAMGTLAAGLAHEINSPLAGALHGLETLRGEATSERAKRHGDLTGDALNRIAGLVQRLLRLAPTSVEAGECEVMDLVDDLRTFLAGRLHLHALRVHAEPGSTRVCAAPGDLFPVLLNLLRNSLDALDQDRPEGGWVALKLQPQDDTLILVIEDNGGGVDADLMPHLFEPFVTTKDVGQGTGLGLALAHATVRQLGGSLEAANRDAGGLCVRLLLPAVAAQDA